MAGSFWGLKLNMTALGQKETFALQQTMSRLLFHSHLLLCTRQLISWTGQRRTNGGVGGPAPVRGSALTLTIEDGLGVGVRWLTLFYSGSFVAVVDRLLPSLIRKLNLRLAPASRRRVAHYGPHPQTNRPWQRQAQRRL
jgi:hypothetical protein